jgi:heme/copper-type cytochrome/quinol oxidase subunit 4
MKTIFSYIGRYFFYETDKRVLAGVSILTALLIYVNYHYTLDDDISNQSSFYTSLWSRFLIFLVAFGLPYFFYWLAGNRNTFRNLSFVALLLIAPAIFSLKIALVIPLHLSDDPGVNIYWNHVLYWPVLLVIILFLLLLCWRIFNREQPFYGISAKGLQWKPYWIMLLIMLPLIAAASTQPDFLAMYPKLKTITQYNLMDLSWWHKLLFELSYGSDFITIELFFRGFLILAFIKWAGKDAILPMACFYCTIHFGKPLAECISSYFGGLLLGIVVYNTRSIYGGLMVHLGIAWMMELGGYLGNAI